MKIKTIQIKNFRSIRFLNEEFDSFNILVGQNNHGKTNFLDAIDWFFNAKKLNINDKWMQDEDIEVTITFTWAQNALTEMKNEKNIASIQWKIGADDEVTLKRNSVTMKRILVVNGQDEWSPWWTDSVLNDFLPKVEYIRTTTRLDDVNQYKATSPIGQMLSDVLSTIIEKDPSYQVFKRKFQEVFEGSDSKMREELDALGLSVQSFLEKQFPDWTTIRFNVEPTPIEDILKNFETEVDDWVKTAASSKWDGMQRAIMLSIIQAYAKYRKDHWEWKSFLFLVDEAELHLHPSAQRALKKALNDIANSWDQIFVNTHSSVLIVDELLNQMIFKVEKNQKITTVERVSEIGKINIIFDLLWWSPSDLLLPRNFLIVEWRSEFVFISKIIERFYSDKFRGIKILFSWGDIEMQEPCLLAVHRLFSPLAWSENPIYKDKAIILIDKPNTTQQNKYDMFKNWYPYLFKNNQIFQLETNTLELYYPNWFSQESIADEEKVTYATSVANTITREQFECWMPILYSALTEANNKAFNPL